MGSGVIFHIRFARVRGLLRSAAECFRLAWVWWFAFFAGFVGGIEWILAHALGNAPSFPPSAWVTVMGAGAVVGVFAAFHKVRVARDTALTERDQALNRTPLGPLTQGNSGPVFNAPVTIIYEGNRPSDERPPKGERKKGRK